MQIEYTRLDALEAWPRNPKSHDLPKICASLRRFGFVSPIVIDEGAGRIVAGHGREAACRALRDQGEAPPDRVVLDQDGEWMVPVLRGVSFEDPGEAEAFLVADNRLVELGGWDDTELRAMLEHQRDHIASVAEGEPGMLQDLYSAIGYSQREVEKYLTATAKRDTGGKTPQEKLDGFLEAEIKQIVLYFGSSEYDATIERLDALMDKFGVESHTEVICKLIEEA